MAELTKHAFLERLRIERVKWLALLELVEPDWRDEPGVVGIWSVRDLVVHIGIWETWGAGVARSIATGQAVSRSTLFGVDNPPGAEAMPLDPFNIWLVEQYAGRRYEQVSADEQTAYQRFVAAFEALDEADLAKPASAFTIIADFGDDLVREVMADQSFNHWREHAETLQVWLKQRKPAHW